MPIRLEQFKVNKKPEIFMSSNKSEATRLTAAAWLKKLNENGWPEDLEKIYFDMKSSVPLSCIEFDDAESKKLPIVENLKLHKWERTVELIFLV